MRCLLSILACGLLAGCVSASKRTVTRHERWEYEGGTPGMLVTHEIWEDRSHGGGTAVFADPQASELATTHQNQNALGGSNSFSLGHASSKVSAEGIKATGAAVGSVAGKVIEEVFTP